MASDTGVANLALSHIGIGKEIANLANEQSEEAAACRRFYADNLDSTLRDFPWPFARTRAVLGLVAENPVETDEWGFSYRWPADCLAIQKIPTGLRNEAPDQAIPYSVGRDVTGRLIYTDKDEAKIQFTSRVTDPGQWDSDFVMALSLRLGALIAPRLTGGDPDKMADKTMSKYLLAISMAEKNAANEEQIDQPPDAELIRAREGDDSFLPPGQGAGRPFGT